MSAVQPAHFFSKTPDFPQTEKARDNSLDFFVTSLFDYAIAFLAISARAVKPAASLTAISASIFC